MPPSLTPNDLLRSIRFWLAIFIVGLIVSGLTAFPLVSETGLLTQIATYLHLDLHAPGLFLWIIRVHHALVETGVAYPFLAYGTDWLAFAHLVLAIAFLGPYRDPIRNQWTITFGLIACAAVPLLAFIAGPIRGIPIYWRLIDSSFGLIGCIPLLIVLHRTRQLEQISGSP